MSALQNWLLSAPTAQILLGGQHAQLVEELRRLWDGPRVLKDLGPHREQLAKLTKRAKRALPAWLAKLEEDLCGNLGKKPRPKQLAATEALFSKVKRIADEVVQHPPLAPAPALDRAVYRTLMSGLPPVQRRTLARHVRRIPAPILELLSEQRGNAWLAAHLVDLFLDESVNPPRLKPWLEDWSVRARIPLPAGELEAWHNWLAGHARRPPDLTANFVTYCVGRIANATGTRASEVETADVESEHRATSAQPANPSKIYSVKEAATAFNLPVWRLRKAVERGELKASRPTASPNAPLQFRDSDIRDYLAAQAGNRQRAPKNPNLTRPPGKREEKL